MKEYGERNVHISINVSEARLCPRCERELNGDPGHARQERPQYSTDGGRLNIPKRLLEEAGIPEGQSITVVAADGALLLMAAQDEIGDLPVEVCALLNELGISPLSVRSFQQEEPF